MASVLVSFLDKILGNKVIIFMVLVNGIILGQSNVSYATLLSIQHSNVPNYPPITCKIMLI